MADENVTASENTNETTEQATTPAVKASKPAVPSPASMKPHAPSPAAFAKKAPQHTAPTAASTGFSDADVKTAEAFGRVADDGTVFVKDGEGEREVGQFPDASKEEALALYARRYLDLKAKLDLFANKLKSNNVKSREIDETIKTLSAETEQPAVVGDLAALKAQFEALKEEGAAKKTALTEARKAAIAKAVEERTAIVEKAEALQDSTAWVETSRKFTELMDRWKKAGRAGRRDDDAMWERFRAAADTFFNARQADRDQISSSEKENLAKKEELLVKAEALVPVKSEEEAKQARQALAAIQEEWDQIGYVPRDEVRRIEGRLDAVDKQIKAIEDAAWKQSDPEADARKSSFEEQLNAQLAELDQKIAAESDPKKKAKLESEKATKEQWLNAIK